MSIPTRWHWMWHNINLYLNQSGKYKKETTVIQSGWWGLQCQLIRSIVSIVFVLIDAINSVNHFGRINCIDRGVLRCSALQLKNNSNDSTNSGMTFGVLKGGFSILLACTGICKYFTRSVLDISNIALWVMTINSPWGKIFTLWNHWDSNIFPI